MSDKREIDQRPYEGPFSREWEHFSSVQSDEIREGRSNEYSTNITNVAWQHDAHGVALLIKRPIKAGPVINRPFIQQASENRTRECRLYITFYNEEWKRQKEYLFVAWYLSLPVSFFLLFLFFFSLREVLIDECRDLGHEQTPSFPDRFELW